MAIDDHETPERKRKYEAKVVARCSKCNEVVDRATYQNGEPSDWHIFRLYGRDERGNLIISTTVACGPVRDEKEGS